ncbi:UBN2_3 domain-containing protein [Cephalotus follicularis]|uniref:UBN2_3 domain-containing protein n=1 Tax=Cephalotus follicularis TaxID=3775 RepID=A0A1Q3D881_CEPFO|nr:UBN2_3 domain-containing protein [Cephalotus follicularis]
MDPTISDTCMFLKTAKEIWDSIRRMYSKDRDAAQLYEIKVKTSATKQGCRTVTEYANTLQNLWQEFDHYLVFEMKCSEDAIVPLIMHSLYDCYQHSPFIRDFVYDFLVGLNLEFDQVIIQILRKEEIPSLEETISLIRAEESRRGIMLEPQAFEGSALVTQNAHAQQEEK